MLNRIGDIYLNKVYRSHIGILKNSATHQELLFKQIQRRLAGTALANDIKLTSFPSFRSFIKNFTPRHYDFYEPYVKRIMNGERSVMFRDATEYYFVTSGTSGFNNKIIPCNTTLKKLIITFQKRVLSAVFPECEGVHVATDRFSYGMRTKAEYIDGIPKDYISGVWPSLVPSLLKEYVFPTPETLAEPCWETKVKRMVEEIRHRDIRAISGLPAYLLHVLKEIVEAMNIQNLREIWPRLELCVYSGTSVHQYQKGLDHLAGVQLKYFGGYVSTESPIGFEMPNVTTQPEDMVFVPDLILYSFQDLNKSAPTALTLDELQVGGEYLVNIGTPNGLVHYAMNDYIRVTDVFPFVQFEFHGRHGSAMNIAAEKVSEIETAKAVQLLQDLLPVKIDHYFVYPSENADGEPVYEWVFATENNISAGEMSEHVDKALMHISADYREVRLEARVLAKPVVQWMSPKLIKRHIAQKQSGGLFKTKTSFPDKKAFSAFMEQAWEQ